MATGLGIDCVVAANSAAEFGTAIYLTDRDSASELCHIPCRRDRHHGDSLLVGGDQVHDR
jgi:hypothetical protein